MNIVVIGAGKMGLPLACQFAQNGGFVTVCDIKRDIVEKINSGIPPFEEPGLEDCLPRTVQWGHLKASVNTSQEVAIADIVVVIVPAVLTANNDIDYGNLNAASEAIAAGLKPGMLVSYETTVPVGSTRNILIPILEKSGLKAGVDFFVCFSPERVKSLRVFQHLLKNPKIVGGYNEKSAEKGEQFYKIYLGAPVINVGSLEAAEMVKLAGMIYRDVNIALAHELSAYSEALGLDAYKINAAANTDGEAFILDPGIGVGGHCTPVYPYFLIKHAAGIGIPQRLAEMGRAINEDQPRRNIERVIKVCGPLEDKTVHILGIAFRGDVKEHYCSPAFTLREILMNHGAKVSAEDPLYSDDEISGLGFTPARTGIDTMDIVILHTAHSAFQNPSFTLWQSKGVKLVLDGRNYWNREDVEKAGLVYIGVGKP